MIEVAAFPALVLRPRDKVTSPLGDLWLQGFSEGRSAGGTGAGLCWERCRNLSSRLRPEDMLPSHEGSWAVTLSGLDECHRDWFAAGQLLTHVTWMTHLARLR